MKGIFFDLKMWKIALTKMKIAPKFLSYLYKENWPIPNIEHDNEILVKTLLAGICGSDIHQSKLDLSYYASVLGSAKNPSPIGHEVIGVVEETRGNSSIKVGDRVVLNPSVHCESYGFKPCPSCVKGDREHCYTIVGKGDGSHREKEFQPFRGQINGGFSEYFKAFEKNLYKIPENIPNHIAVLLEPFSIGLHAVLRNYPADDHSILVIGAGTIGLMVIAALRALGSKAIITCIARHTHQAEFAKKLGADEIVMDTKNKTILYTRIAEMKGSHIVNPLMRKPYLYGTKGVNVIFDSVASESTIEDSFHMIASGGKIVLIGMEISKTRSVDWGVMMFKEVTVTGAFLQGISEFKGKLIDEYDFGLNYMSQNVSLFENFVTHRFSLSEYKDAFFAFQNKSKTKAIKVIFDYT